MILASQLRAPNLCSAKITWHLKNYVANEENAGGEPKLSGRKLKILVHSVRSREGNGCPIEIVDEEHQGEKGDEPDGELCDRGLFDGIHGHVTAALLLLRGDAAAIGFIVADPVV
jgi:hypothetical protein